MKKFFLPIFAVLLVLGSILPLAAYRITRAVLSGAEPASSAVSSPAASAQPPSAVPSADAETFLVEDQATGQVLELSRQEYVLGAVAAEMPVSWPDEALKAQAVAAHSYALYCRDHTTLQSGAWLTADPARRQGCLTEPVLRRPSARRRVVPETVCPQTVTVFVYPALVSAAGPNQPSDAARSAEMPRPARACCNCSAEKVTVYS